MGLVRSAGGTRRDALAATLTALSRAGSVSRVLSVDLPSLNGRPAEFYKLFRDSYVKETRTTTTDRSVQTELVPGEVSSGFSFSYEPRITGPDEVLVRLVASIQDRPTFTVFESANQQIQLPRFGSRAINVSLKIARGEIAIVTGFSERATNADRAGTFTSDLPFPGGHRRGGRRRVEQVLLIAIEVGAPLGVSEIQGAVF